MRHLHDLAGQIKVRSRSCEAAVHRGGAAACCKRWLDQDRPQRVVRSLDPHCGEHASASSGRTEQKKGCRRAAEVSCESGGLQAT